MFLWLINAELWTRSVWKDKLHVAMELTSLLLNLMVLDIKKNWI